MSLRAEGTSQDVNLYLKPKGGGNVAFGEVTLSADAPIVGYITIKDASGVIRKLGVIS